MAFPSTTYTLTNGTTADASQVQQNFQDLINGFSDGTKSLNMAAGTFLGSVSISGAVTLGLSTSNLITWNGSLNSSIAISTTNSYDIGSDPFGLRSIYFGSGSSAHSVRLIGPSVLSAYTFTLPLTAGSNRQVLQTDGSGVTSFVSNPRSGIDAQNLGLATSVGSNALTIALKGADGTDPSATNIVDIVFRNSTVTTGTPSVVSSTAATSLVVPSSATLGNSSGVSQDLYVYALNNAGTIELAIASSNWFDEGTVQSSTAITSGSTSGFVLYSTSNRSNVAVRLIGRLKSNQTVAGTWAANMSEVSLFPHQNSNPRSQVWLDTGNGHGSSSTRIRRFTNPRVNIGPAITYADSSTLGGTFTINEDGLYAIHYNDSNSAAAESLGITVNDSALTTNVSNPLTYAQGLRAIVRTAGAAFYAQVSWTGYLNATDIVRAHDNAGSDANSNTLCAFSITKISNQHQ